MAENCPRCGVEHWASRCPDPPRSDAPPLQGLRDLIAKWRDSAETEAVGGYGDGCNCTFMECADELETAADELARALPGGEQERARLRGEAVMADAHRRSELMAETCAWTQDEDTDDLVYDTGCGWKFTFIDGGPRLNGLTFCCFCSKPLREVPVHD